MNNLILETDEQLAAEYQEPLLEELVDHWRLQDAVNPMHMPWAVPSMYDVDPVASGDRWRNAGYGPGRAARNRGLPQKQRFCATYPNVSRCRHGAHCAFAHSRDEVTAPLLSPEEEAAIPDALTVEFFTEKFKTMWCPIGAQHDWQACMYAHTYQDVRRPPALGYGHQLCPYWNKKETNLAYSQRCPLGPRCPFAHGAKEQLYHPNYFRTLVCRDLQRRRCPRAHLCAFFHRQTDCRKIKHDPVDYSRPLPEKAVPSEWLLHFLSPPKFQEATQEGLGIEHFMPSAMLPMHQIPQMPMYPAFCKEDWDSGTESTAEELHEDAETTSSLAATHVPPSLTLGAEDAWALLQSGHKGEEYWNEAMPYLNQYSEAYPSYTGLLNAAREGMFAAPVQAAHASSYPRKLQGLEGFEDLENLVSSSLLSHLGIGDVAASDLFAGRDI